MDFFSDLGWFGAEGPRFLRRPLAILGVLIGAGVGAYLGYTSSGILAGIGGFFTGAFIGFGLSMILAGALLFLAIFLVAVAVTVGWQWLTGGL